MKKVLAIVICLGVFWSNAVAVYAEEMDAEVIAETVEHKEETEFLETTDVTEGAEEVSLLEDDLLSTSQSDETSREQLKIEYVVIDKEIITTGDKQNIIVGVSGVQINDGTWELECHDTYSGEMLKYVSSKNTEEALLFEIQDTSTYQSKINLHSLIYKSENFEQTIVLSDVGIDAAYEICADPIISESTDELCEQLDVESDDATSIEDAIEESEEETTYEMSKEEENLASGSNIVIVLDPGHDATHGGAGANGLAEANLNFKIAQYCKQELEEYNGVTVYMTHDSLNCPYPGTTSGECNSRRVDFAGSVGANLYVALHNNSSSSTAAQGCEVYYPNSSGNINAHNIGAGVAGGIQSQLVQLGLHDRGIKVRNSTDGDTYNDGQVSDYYGVIRNAKRRYGMPSIIVEHAFVTNGSDVANFLSNDSQLRSLGVADATGIANYYGLTKGLSINGICYQYQKDRIDVGASYKANDDNTIFKWQAFNLDKNEWTTIADWNGGNWASWKPRKGNYWLMVEAKNAKGEYDSSIICFNVGKSYLDDYIDLDGMCWNYKSNQIDLGVAYDTNDTAVQFKWQTYDLDRDEWVTIADWNSGNWVSWKPKKGNYWVQVQAKTRKGTLETKTICFSVDRDYRDNYIDIDGICWNINKNSIDVGVAYTTNAKNYKCVWQAYNLDKKEWTTIAQCDNANWATWKPEKGNYWLHVELDTPTGGHDEKTICFSADKDYSKSYIATNGICVIDNQYDYSLGVAYESDDPSVAFRWQIYNADTNQWSLLSDWSGTNWVSWAPDNGNYWIYVQGRNSDGAIADYCISYGVSARYLITGTGATSVQQMANYYRANAVYPSFYTSSDAPNIETFCQLYIEECQAEGIKTEVAFCQAMKETGFLRYGGDVRIEQYNFAGLGATGGGNPGNSFSSVREGIRAQIQHLKAYACTDPLNQPVVDPRFQYVSRGTAKYVEWLGIQENPYGKGWATAQRYGYSVVKDYIAKMFTY